jgi:hypothetical protein
MTMTNATQATGEALAADRTILELWARHSALRLELAADDAAVEAAQAEGDPATIEAAHKHLATLEAESQAIEDAISGMRSTDPNVIVAQLLLREMWQMSRDQKVADDYDLQTALIAARAFRQQLRGVLAIEVAELLDNPTLPLGETRIWKGSADA